MTTILDGLNPHQRVAASTTEGPVLIFAGAGSGKTRALTYRIAYMVREAAIAPERVLAVTFTNKAADEMKYRIADLVGEMARRIWAGTFHSVCARILRIDGEALGIPNNFVVFDEGDQQALVRQALVDANYDTKQYKPADVLNAISRAKNEMLGPDAYRRTAKGPFEKVVSAVYHRYEAGLMDNRALDFDDLIGKTVELFETRPDILDKWQERFRYILVDEYQDINNAQYRFVSLLAAKHRNICVVGDDDQSIYGWRGANVGLILRFRTDYPDAQVIYLEQNYRSSSKILRAANAVIAQNKTRASKQLWTNNPEGEDVTVYQAVNETEEAEWVVGLISKLAGPRKRYGDFAVLYRTNSMSRSFEEALIEARIPYRIVGGVRFYERAEVKDLICYLRVIHNPRDSVSAHRIVARPPRGIGEKTAERAEQMTSGTGLSFLEACARLVDNEELRTAARHALHDFVELIDYLRSEAGRGSLSNLAKLVAEKTGYLAWLRASSRADQQARAENVEEFVNLAAEYERRHPDADLAMFLEHMALMSDIDEAGELGNQVALMTLHSAKGLEFPVVVVVGLEDGIFPHERSMGSEPEIEEERRLCYVGITRAMEQLYLTYSSCRRIYGELKAMRPSRFLRDLPAEGVRVLSMSGLGLDFREPPPPGQVSEDQAPRPKQIDLISLVDGARRMQSGKAAKAAGSKPAATEPAEGAGPTAVRPGDKVLHNKFGEGTVFSVEGAGDDAVITVIFKQAGIRKLSAQYARLEHVE
jgi:DNA helicase-2/ATP-dependent DNA helicase PcrA